MDVDIVTNIFFKWFLTWSLLIDWIFGQGKIWINRLTNVRETLTEHLSKLKSTPQTTIYLYYHYEMITMLMLLAIKKHTAVKKRWGNNQVFLVKTSEKTLPIITTILPKKNVVFINRHPRMKKFEMFCLYSRSQCLK